MMAARAGCSRVVGAELSAAMCDAAERTLARNGLASKCAARSRSVVVVGGAAAAREALEMSDLPGRRRFLPAAAGGAPVLTLLSRAPRIPRLRRCVIVNRDARRLLSVDSSLVRSGLKPEGTAPELDQRADLMVFELFDSGLLGEGVLHVTAHANQHLLQPHAVMVPSVRETRAFQRWQQRQGQLPSRFRRMMPPRVARPLHSAQAARVYCQLVQRRCGPLVAGVDLTDANRYHWRPDYEGADLNGHDGQDTGAGDWVALTDPVEAFAFDFHRAAQHVARGGEERVLLARAVRGGVANGVVFWFDLAMDEQGGTLSTSPYGA